MVSEKDISELKSGNRKVQKAIFEQLYPRLLQITLRYSQDSMLAEDAVTTAFIKALKGIQYFEYQHIHSFYAWIKKIAIREILYELRKKNNFLFVDIDDSNKYTIEPSVISKLDAADILKLLEKLPVSQKAVFLLVVVEGYSHDECANMMEITIDNSKTLLHRAKQKLQILINKYSERRNENEKLGR